MVFWAGILAAAFFAWLAVKIGFYETWTMLFNIVISIYLSIFLTPATTTLVPAAGDTAYGNALTLITVAVGAFLILHGVSYSLLTGRFSVWFPRPLDNVGSGLLGFLGGLLIWSFVTLVISASPVSQRSFARNIDLRNAVEQTSVPYIAWWCDMINAVVATGDNKHITRAAIDRLLQQAREAATLKMTEQAELTHLPKPDATKTEVVQPKKSGRRTLTLDFSEE
jgi:hypothetical protein